MTSGNSESFNLSGLLRLRELLEERSGTVFILSTGRPDAATMATRRRLLARLLGCPRPDSARLRISMWA